jgi:uncharacterized protein YjbI with pentapeptide repeats
MKSELQKILSMTKAGTITEAQAAQLIEALQAAPEPRRARGSVISDVIDAVRSVAEAAGSSSVQGVYASELGQNELSMSKVQLVEARGHTFTGNVISSSSLEGLRLDEAQVLENVIRASRLDEATLLHSRLSGCEFASSSLDELHLAHSVMERVRVASSSLDDLRLEGESTLRDCEFGSASWKHARLVASSIVGARVSGSHVRDLSLERAELTDAQLSASHLHDLSITRSDWHTTFLRQVRFADVRFEGCSFEDVLFAGTEGWKRQGYRDVRFEGCTFGKVVFSDCHFKDVVLRDIELTDLTISGLTLKDCEVVGADALRAALAQRVA